MTAITFDTTYVIRLPVARAEMGFPSEGDRGNAVLLVAEDMGADARVAYQQVGCLHEGVCILSLEDQVFDLLDGLKAQWCPWPDRGFTLAVWPHERIGVLADRLLVQRLAGEEASATQTVGPREETA